MTNTTQEIRINCPDCDNTSLKGRFDPQCYVNIEKDTWHCFRCTASGKAQNLNLEELNIVSITAKKPLDRSRLRDFEPAEESRNYLRRRFPDTDLMILESNYGLTYNPELKALVIPVTNLQKELQGIKYRILNPVEGQSKYLAETGSKIGNYWLPGSNKRKLLLVEGEIDAIAAQMAGFNGDILALQTNKITQDHAKEFKRYSSIFACLDNDEAGQEGLDALKAAWIPFTAIFPPSAKDLSQTYQEEGREALGTWLKNATMSELEKQTVNISKIWDQMMDFICNREKTKGVSTGFKNIDVSLGGGLRPSEMTVVNSFAKIGKSTFVNNIVHNVVQQNKSVLVISFEMTPENHFFPTLLSIAGGINLRSIPYEEVREVSAGILATAPYLKNIKMLKKFGHCPWDEVKEWINSNFDDKHYDLVILDHVGFLVKDMTDAAMNQSLAQDIAKLCREKETHIVSVVQSPYPITPPREGTGIRPYGGAAWTQNPDNYIQLERSKEHQDALNVYVKHVRYPFNDASDKAQVLLYDRDSCKLDP
jgi:hypothetical protein